MKDISIHLFIFLDDFTDLFPNITRSVDIFRNSRSFSCLHIRYNNITLSSWKRLLSYCHYHNMNKSYRSKRSIHFNSF